MKLLCNECEMELIIGVFLTNNKEGYKCFNCGCEYTIEQIDNDIRCINSLGDKPRGDKPTITFDAKPISKDWYGICDKGTGELVNRWVYETEENAIEALNKVKQNLNGFKHTIDFNNFEIRYLDIVTYAKES